MNRKRLFWHLFSFHFQTPPSFLIPILLLVSLFLCLMFGLIDSMGGNVSMGSYRNPEQITFYLYVFIIASQMSWGMQWGRSALQSQNWAMGSYAFLFTRPIYRPTLYWAKLTVFFSIICLIPILPNLARTIYQPDIRIQLYQSPQKQAEKVALYRANYPNLTLTVPNKNPKDQLVTLPAANWDQFSLKSAQIFFISLAILCLSSLARRWPKIWISALILFMLLVVVPPIGSLITKNHTWGIITWTLFFEDEATLFWMHAHEAMIWSALAVLGLAIIWDSRRSFLKIPHYKNALV